MFGIQSFEEGNSNIGTTYTIVLENGIYKTSPRSDGTGEYPNLQTAQAEADKLNRTSGNSNSDNKTGPYWNRTYEDQVRQHDINDNGGNTYDILYDENGAPYIKTNEYGLGAYASYQEAEEEKAKIESQIESERQDGIVDTSNDDLSVTLTEEKMSDEEFDEIWGDASSIIAGTKTEFADDKFRYALANNINGIFGIPYQFPLNVDVPSGSIGDTSGRKYVEKILTQMPVLFLNPGEPEFMKDYSRSNKKTILNNFSDGLLSEYMNSSELGEGKYYTFQSTFPDYATYVNLAARTLILYMGIGSVVIKNYAGDNIQLKNFRIEKFLSPDFNKLFGSVVTIPFYVDAETSVSESFGNDTTDSALASQANEYSTQVNEIKFLLGGHSANLEKAAESIVGGTSDFLNGIGDITKLASAGKSNIISRLANDITTVVSGGKISFPQIWSDSSYGGGSMSVNMKFRSPDPDPVSIFLNVYLPIILLISMAAPRQLLNGGNTLQSPFIVRATYKSIFNCNMGIIGGLEITKGGENCWNAAGMATQADVSVSITDLYKNMFVSNNQGIVNNTAQMDFLATMAGLNLNEPEHRRQSELLKTVYMNKLTDMPGGSWMRLTSWGSKKVASVVSRIPILSRYVDQRLSG